MKTASAGLISHLTDGHAFRRADLWQFTLADGTIIRYTTLDADVTIGVDTWLANGPVLTRPRSRLVAGTEVDEFEVTVEGRDAYTVGSLSWPEAARRGVLRHGRLLIERVYMPSFIDVSLGKLYMMGGRMAEIHGDGAQVKIAVRSDLELLNTKFPVDVVQPSCRHTLFDAGCTLSAAAFKVTGVVVNGSTVSTILVNLGEPEGFFSLGRVVFTSGPNNGASRRVKLHIAGASSPAILKLAVPLFAAPVAGNTLDLYPGCDRTQATCTNKYANLVNFGGQPYVPRPETAA